MFASDVQGPGRSDPNPSLNNSRLFILEILSLYDFFPKKCFLRVDGWLVVEIPLTFVCCIFFRNNVTEPEHFLLEVVKILKFLSKSLKFIAALKGGQMSPIHWTLICALTKRQLMLGFPVIGYHKAPTSICKPLIAFLAFREAHIRFLICFVFDCIPNEVSISSHD